MTLHDHRAATTARGLAVVLPAVTAAGVKRFVKQTPFLWRAVVKARALVAALTRRDRKAGAESESAQLIQQAPNPSIVQEHQRLIREGHVSGQDEAAVEKAFLGRESQVAEEAKTGTNEHR